MLRSLLVATGLIVGTTGFITTAVTTLQAAQPSVPLTTSQLLLETNKERVAALVPPLTIDERLNRSAQEKCQHMVDGGYWGHEGPDGSTPVQFITRHIPIANIGSENLFKGRGDAYRVVSDWMASPSHRAAILTPTYTHVGYATCVGHDNKTMVVQHFVTL